ncbi:hypothetical protein HAX54_006623 [Datura stramonium]|uniref:Uncharacterized protein n=1 Tax=Datura stramonium TaxID=4076 RepID=A0ABS8TC04_DATST|nr:hypothetical protein [Datura stramonium]
MRWPKKGSIGPNGGQLGSRNARASVSSTGVVGVDNFELPISGSRVVALVALIGKELPMGGRGITHYGPAISGTTFLVYTAPIKSGVILLIPTMDVSFQDTFMIAETIMSSRFYNDSITIC